jgi:hypothetical protein
LDPAALTDTLRGKFLYTLGTRKPDCIRLTLKNFTIWNDALPTNSFFIIGIKPPATMTLVGINGAGAGLMPTGYFPFGVCVNSEDKIMTLHEPVSIILLFNSDYATETIEIKIFNPGTTPYAAIDANTFLNANCVLTEFVSPYVFA